MGIQTTPHTQVHEEPAQADFDQNQLSNTVGDGYDGQEFQDLKEAQTAGSRNERVTEYSGNEHNVEPTTAAEFQTENRPRLAADAAGITNHSLQEEEKQQGRVAGKRPDAVGPVDPLE